MRCLIFMCSFRLNWIFLISPTILWVGHSSVATRLLYHAIYFQVFDNRISSDILESRIILYAELQYCVVIFCVSFAVTSDSTFMFSYLYQLGLSST